jgi:hypothetical protein
MDKKLVIIITIILIFVSTTAGCFEEDKPKPKGIELVEANGALNGTTGWIDSTDVNGRDGDQIYVELSGQIPVYLNDTNIYSITISLSFDDHDTAHEGSDGNSPEDRVDVQVEGYDATGSGTTPCMITLNLKGNMTDGVQDYINPELNILVTGQCYCEITYPRTGRPSLMNLYTRDQGIAYEVSSVYKYHEIQ